MSPVQVFRKHCGKRRNCSQRGIFPFPTVFSTPSGELSTNFINFEIVVWKVLISVWESLKFVIRERVKCYLFLQTRKKVTVYTTYQTIQSFILLEGENLKTLFNPLPNNKVWGLSKWKAFADDIKCISKLEICFSKGRKQFGKRRKYWLPAFSPFPSMFSKAFFFQGR